MAPGVLITAFLFWTAFYVLLSTVISIRQTTNTGLLMVYLRLIIPICALFAVLTLRQVMTNDLRIFVGSNFILSVLIMVGRYQFIRTVVEGHSYRAYKTPLEIVPLLLGVLGYVFIQVAYNFQEESSIGFEGVAASSFQAAAELPYMKLIYVVILNLDILLLVSQSFIIKEYKAVGQFSDRIRNIHKLSMAGIIGRVLVYAGAIVLSEAVYTTGVLVTLSILTFVVIQLQLLDTDEFPVLTRERKTSLSSEDTIWQGLMQGLQKDQWYLDFNLQFQEVSERLKVSPAQLRRSIQSHTDLNFPDMVNVHRIDHLMGLRDQIDIKEISIEELARRCGFKSRITLYRASKKWLGLTPSSVTEYKGAFSIAQHLLK